MESIEGTNTKFDNIEDLISKVDLIIEKHGGEIKFKIEPKKTQEIRIIYEIPKKGGIIANFVKDGGDHRYVVGPMTDTHYATVLIYLLGFRNTKKISELYGELKSLVGPSEKLAF